MKNLSWHIQNAMALNKDLLMPPKGFLVFLLFGTGENNGHNISGSNKSKLNVVLYLALTFCSYNFNLIHQ